MVSESISSTIIRKDHLSYHHHLHHYLCVPLMVMKTLEAWFLKSLSSWQTDFEISLCKIVTRLTRTALIVKVHYTYYTSTYTLLIDEMKRWTTGLILLMRHVKSHEMLRDFLSTRSRRITTLTLKPFFFFFPLQTGSRHEFLRPFFFSKCNHESKTSFINLFDLLLQESSSRLHSQSNFGQDKSCLFGAPFILLLFSFHLLFDRLHH